MNYSQLLKDSLRILRNTKLIWVFGFLTLITITPLNLRQYLGNNLAFTCIFFLISIVFFYIYLVAIGGLVSIIQRASQKKQTTFSEAWLQGKSKAGRILVLSLLFAPLALITTYFSLQISSHTPQSPLWWLLAIFQYIIFVSLTSFGFCAIVIDNISIWSAAWISIQITIKNFLRTLVIFGAIFLARLLVVEVLAVVLESGLFTTGLPFPLTFDYPTYLQLTQIPIIYWASFGINIFLTPLQVILSVLGYIKFTEGATYPALVKSRAANQPPSVDNSTAPQ